MQFISANPSNLFYLWSIVRRMLNSRWTTDDAVRTDIHGFWLARGLVILGLLVLSSAGFAQNAASMRGQVVDDTGAVISGAHVVLTGSDGKTRTTTANANGEITIANGLPRASTMN